MSQAAPRAGRWPYLALALAVCAALSAWNPFAAPAGLVVGLGSAFIGWRVLSRKGQQGRRVALCALVLGASAAAASAAIILLSAGTLSTERQGEAVIPGRAPAEVERLLGEAERSTRAARNRAADELDRPPRTRPAELGQSDGGSASDGGALQPR